MATDELPKLSHHEQEVLKNILEHAKLPDADIARLLGLSPQAVFKIRHKLEERHIIKGYQPIIDFTKLGISMLAMLVINLTPKVWETTTEAQIAERIRKIPAIIQAYRIVEQDASHILLMGFVNHAQMERHLMRLQTKFATEIEIKQLYRFSADNIITQSPLGLLSGMLHPGEISLDEVFLQRKKR